MHKKVQRISTVCILLLLILLFTLPGRYLHRVADDMTEAVTAAEMAIASGGDPQNALLRLTALYEKHSGTWRLFLDHVSVDAVGAAIAACTPLSEPDALLPALRAVRAALSHVVGIETLSPESLL